jgi:hypothetical protein
MKLLFPVFVVALAAVGSTVTHAQDRSQKNENGIADLCRSTPLGQMTIDLLQFCRWNENMQAARVREEARSTPPAPAAIGVFRGSKGTFIHPR